MSKQNQNCADARNTTHESPIGPNETREASELDADAYWSYGLKGMLSELYAASIHLRRAWIAPQRFNTREAEMRLVEISDKIQQQIAIELE